MDELELDEWFTQRREQLEERFYVAAQKNSVRAKEAFDKDYRKLIEDLQARELALNVHRQRAAALKAPFSRAATNIALFFAPIGTWPHRISERVRKWWFDRKIKKILNDKSDLYH